MADLIVSLTVTFLAVAAAFTGGWYMHAVRDRYRAEVKRDRLSDAARQVVAELGDDGRIGRTLLTGALPTNANLARRECLALLTEAIRG